MRCEQIQRGRLSKSYARKVWIQDRLNLQAEVFDI